MPEKIKQLAQNIELRSDYLSAGLRAIEFALQQGKDDPAKAHDACIAGLEILASMNYTQDAIPLPEELG